MTTGRPRVIVPRVRARTPLRRVSRDRESSRQHDRLPESEEGSPSTWQLAPAPKRSQRPALTAPVAHRPGAAAAPPFITLVYELLDAHLDTTLLAVGLEQDLLWSAHLDYLRALQRVGRESLAQLLADPEG
jgi:hypothetical protein